MTREENQKIAVLIGELFGHASESLAAATAKSLESFDYRLACQAIDEHSENHSLLDRPALLHKMRELANPTDGKQRAALATQEMELRRESAAAQKRESEESNQRMFSIINEMDPELIEKYRKSAAERNPFMAQRIEKGNPKTSPMLAALIIAEDRIATAQVES